MGQPNQATQPTRTRTERGLDMYNLVGLNVDTALFGTSQRVNGIEDNLLRLWWRSPSERVARTARRLQEICSLFRFEAMSRELFSADEISMHSGTVRRVAGDVAHMLHEGLAPDDWEKLGIVVNSCRAVNTQNGAKLGQMFLSNVRPANYDRFAEYQALSADVEYMGGEIIFPRDSEVSRLLGRNNVRLQLVVADIVDILRREWGKGAGQQELMHIERVLQNALPETICLFAKVLGTAYNLSPSEFWQLGRKAVRVTNTDSSPSGTVRVVKTTR